MLLALQYSDSSTQDKALQTAFRSVCTGKQLILISSHQDMQRLGQNSTLDAIDALRLVEKLMHAANCHVISAGPASARVI